MSKERVYMNIPKEYVREFKNSKTEEPFFKVTIPSSVEVDDKKLGGYYFLTPFADAPMNWQTKERNPEAGYLTIPLGKDYPVRLHKVVKQGEEYKEVDMVEVKPEDLKAAIDKSYKEYKDKQSTKEMEKALDITPERDKKEKSR